MSTLHQTKSLGPLIRYFPDSFSRCHHRRAFALIVPDAVRWANRIWGLGGGPWASNRARVEA